MRPWGQRLRALSRGAANALDLVRRGQLGAPYRHPHEVVHERPVLSLRRYGGEAPARRVGDPVLLVPPLMVTAEVYDISPELSGVGYLVRQGVDVWLVDFGAPEREPGGWSRTLDDHVIAVDEAIGEVARRTGRPVHLLGYSQGGMFCYQAAALRRGAEIASVVTMGSPVDMRRALPVRLHDTLAERVLEVARGAVDGPLDDLRGLPGSLTSRGFKLLSPRQELKHLLKMAGLLHDREALGREQPKRAFLGGEGFIAWPGPAFRDFVEQFVVGNRLRDGGFVIAGRTATLADVAAPILYFVGENDQMARPSSVRAVRAAAPTAETFEVGVAAGHFGLVVGSRAMDLTWPTVAAWVAWRAGEGPAPPALVAPGPSADEPEVPRGAAGRAWDVATDVLDTLWYRLGELSIDVGDVVGVVRWQLPRLARLLSLEDGSRISLGRLLAEQAAATPDAAFFLWEGRAWSRAEANARVSQVARALAGVGLGPGVRLGLWMDNHPDLLTTLGACSRLGAVAVLLPTGLRGAALERTARAGKPEHLLVDAAHLAGGEALAGALGVPLLTLERPEEAGAARSLARLVATAPAEWDPAVTGTRADPGLGHELALVMYTSGTTGPPRAVRITNRRQVAAALWAAIACELTPRSTVYCCLPLQQATGLLAGVGAALVGGARLALAPRFSADTFWEETRRTGSDVVFYVGDLCRELVAAPPRSDDRRHPVRLLVGNGMRPEVWRRVQERFGIGRVIEFYGSTEGNVVLANLSGDKIGSVGRPFTGAGEVAIVRWDADGRARRCGVDEPGRMLARVDPEHPLARFDGYEDAEATEHKLLRDVFVPGDVWFDTGDRLRRDADGDLWFVDRARGPRHS